MAPDRTAPEQQDAACGRAFPMGADARPCKNCTPALRAALRRAAGAKRAHPGQCFRRKNQSRRRIERHRRTRQRSRNAAAAAPARSDGDSGARCAARPICGSARCLRRLEKPIRLRHALDGHVRRSRAGDRRGRNDGAHRHGDLRPAPERKDRGVTETSGRATNIVFLGGGNMANALVGGLVAKRYDARSICVIEISPAARDRIAAHGVRVGVAPDATTAKADTLVLAVKPQDARAALASVAPSIGGKLVISIAAGVRLDSLSRWLGGHRQLVRCMPNTPALVGAGIAGLYALPEVDAEGRERAERILSAVGEVVWVREERLLDTVTAVSGSGPAYLFWLIEQLAAFAERAGIPSADALRLAKHCVLGSAKLALASNEAPAQLRKNVTSKGGTTEAALKVFAEEKLAERFHKALAAATRRGGELGEELGKD